MVSTFIYSKLSCNSGKTLEGFKAGSRWSILASVDRLVDMITSCKPQGAWKYLRPITDLLRNLRSDFQGSNSVRVIDQPVDQVKNIRKHAVT